LGISTGKGGVFHYFPRVQMFSSPIFPQGFPPRVGVMGEAVNDLCGLPKKSERYV